MCPVRSSVGGLCTLGLWYSIEILTGPIHCETSALSLSPFGGEDSADVSWPKTTAETRIMTANTNLISPTPSREWHPVTRERGTSMWPFRIVLLSTLDGGGF